MILAGWTGRCLGWVLSLGRDAFAGAKVVVRNPRPMLSATMILGIGSGVNVALFGVYDGLILKAFPFPSPDRLVSIECRTATTGGLPHPLSVAAAQELASRKAVFEGVSFHSPALSTLLVAGNDAPRVFVSRVSQGFFDTLGTRPALGRRPDVSDAGAAVVLSDPLWRDTFGSDPQVMGRRLTLGGAAVRVVGVAPATFRFPSEHVQLWIAERPTVSTPAGHRDQSHATFARLGPNVSLRQAEAALQGIARSLEDQDPQAYRELSFHLAPLRDQVVGSNKTLVMLLLGAVFCVLLLSCASAANILLARRIQQSGNVSIRLSLGATGPRLIQEIFCENLIVAFLGGLVGLVVASVVYSLTTSFGPAALASVGRLSVGWPIAAFTLGLGLLTAVLVTVLPAHQVWRSQIRPVRGLPFWHLRVTSRGRPRLQYSMCCVQLALAVVLSLGAGLLVRSAWRLSSVDLGFGVDGLYAFFLDASSLGGGQSHLASQLLAEIQEVPGVKAAAMVNAPVLRGVNIATLLGAESRTQARPESLLVNERSVSLGYFRTMGIPIRVGRGFSDEDHQAAPCVAVVNECMAAQLWPLEDAVGKRIDLNALDDEPYLCQIVGVAGDVRDLSLDKAPGPTVYYAYGQRGGSVSTLVVRAVDGAPPPIRPVLTRLQALVPNPQNVDVKSARELANTTLREPRFRAILLLVFAVVGLSLAIGGVYGVTAQVVALRTPEIGIRMALGAQPWEVRRLLMADALSFTLAGLLLGVAISLTCARLLTAFLYEVTPTDTWVYAVVAGMMGLSALLAAYWPTRRADRVDVSALLRAL